MESYISLLRGINVSGKNLIPVSRLKALYESLGFKSATSYIQSGNLVFISKKRPSLQLSNRIEDAIKANFKADVPVIVKTVAEMGEIIRSNPFLKNKKYLPGSLHVSFLAEFPRQDLVDSVEKYSSPPDDFRIRGTVVYLYCPEGYGRTKLSNQFFEKRLAVKSTTRNWRTISVLFKLAGEQ
jgi:uncharacterized protein (DUF1697 family)